LTDEALAFGFVDQDERRVFNPTQAEKDANAIAQAYNNDGRIAAVFSPQGLKRSTKPRRSGFFEVFEGDNVEIERLSFVGNREYFRPAFCAVFLGPSRPAFSSDWIKR